MLNTRLSAALGIALAALPILAAGASGRACSVSSRALFTPVIELYTSEGCDSCPPADRWFSGLKNEAARGSIVPLAFHVDYWDYIGWKDRFADPAFTARQHEVAARGGAKVVYTPQVLLDGREFMQWRRTDAAKLGENGSPAAARAELSVSAAGVEPRALQLSVSGKALQPGRTGSVYVALYENGLVSDVKAGENKGVRLAHDYVVRRWLGPFSSDRAGVFAVAQKLDLPADTVPAHAGIAVVAVDDTGAVLQSVALPVGGCAG